MKLATRYTWSIVLERVLKKIKRKVIKAAPRFELGIKDLQSSALPLGHAAMEANKNLAVDTISKENQKVLFISNGHGEDLIAMRIFDELHQIHPCFSYEVLPLVGEGKVFDRAVSEKRIVKVGFIKSLPSGGFSNQSFRGLLADLSAGLLANTLKQWKYIHWASSHGRVIVSVGDLFPLFLAWISGAKYAFIGTPKSDYTWISGPGSAFTDLYHKIKGTTWEPWEFWLMKSLRCKLVAVRDKITARGLRRHGVYALSPGNPMMDGFKKKDCPESLQKFKRLILLSGSRMPEALNNFQRLINSLALLSPKEPLAILVSTGLEPSLDVLESCLLRAGYEKSFSAQPALGHKALWKKGNFNVFLGPGSFSNWATWGDLGLANAGTATEQLVGLGIPCLSLPGKGPQFNYPFAIKQSRLLGGGVVPCKNSLVLSRRLELLLRNKSLRAELVASGKKRMGSEGGSYNLARLISKYLLMQ